LSGQRLDDWEQRVINKFITFIKLEKWQNRIQLRNQDRIMVQVKTLVNLQEKAEVIILQTQGVNNFHQTENTPISFLVGVFVLVKEIKTFTLSSAVREANL